MQKEAAAEGDVDGSNTADGEMNLTRMATLRTMETDPSTRGGAGRKISITQNSYTAKSRFIRT